MARRLAKESGLDIAQVTGSGPHGRVVKTDIESAARSGGRPQGSTAVAQSGAGGKGLAPQSTALIPAMADDKILALYDKDSYEVVPHDGMRRVIAQRLTQSTQTIPHF